MMVICENHDMIRLRFPYIFMLISPGYLSTFGILSLAILRDVQTLRAKFHPWGRPSVLSIRSTSFVFWRI